MSGKINLKNIIIFVGYFLWTSFLKLKYVKNSLIQKLITYINVCSQTSCLFTKQRDEIYKYQKYTDFQTTSLIFNSLPLILWMKLVRFYVFPKHLLFCTVMVARRPYVYRLMVIWRLIILLHTVSPWNQLHSYIFYLSDYHCVNRLVHHIITSEALLFIWQDGRDRQLPQLKTSEWFVNCLRLKV